MTDADDGRGGTHALRFAVLGSLRVEGPDGEIPIASGKQRALLAALIANVGAVVSTDRLTDALWGDEPTATATKSLQTYVARTRRALGSPSGAAGPIVTRPPGYLLDVDPAAIDIHRFEQLHSEARAQRDHDPAAAIRLLDEAIGLWRGDAWAEFREYDFVLADAERLDELRTAAHEERFDAGLALGRHDALVGPLEAFTAHHPYRERPHRQLMLALYRSGRHADALAVYRRFRARLIDELGLEPSEQLRELEAAVLQQRPELTAAPVAASAPPAIERADGARVPMPSVLAELATRGNFAGREREIERIERLADRVATARRAHLALIVGEAGIGKTRLVAESAVRLHGRVPTVAFGRCDEEQLVPYQPFAESIGALLQHAPDDVRADAEPALTPLVPGPLGAPAVLPTGDSSEARRLLLCGVEAILAALEPPVMVVVDDLHWADRPSLLVLRHLLRVAKPASLLIAATARPESLVPGSGLADLLVAIDPDDVTQFELDGLTVEQATSLAVTDHPGAAPVVEQAWERTGGNPFLLRELLRHVEETGSSTLDTVPPQLREVVARRVGRLEPRLIDVLGAGALLGESFRLGVAARAVGESPADLLDAIETAVRAGIVEPERGDEYRFAHALVRDALVQRLTGGRRLHIHHRLAEELSHAATPGSLAEIAHHRHAALPEGDPQEAVAAAHAAAAHALSTGAHEQAARMTQLAIDELTRQGAPFEAVAEVRLGHAEALIRAGVLEVARTELFALAADAQRRDDACLLASSALLLGDTAPQWGVDSELTELLDDALERLPAEEAALRARLLARLAQAYYYSADSDRRRALTAEAETEARRSGDAEALAWVLSASHDALWGPDDVDGRLDAATKIAALGAALEHPGLRLRGQGMLVANLMEVGRFAEARTATERHAVVAEELNQPQHLRDAQSWRATWALIDGRLDDARRAIEAARELSRRAHDPHGEVIYWIQRYGLAIGRNRPRELDELADAYARLADELAHVPAWRSALAAVHARRGELAAARSIVDRQVANRLAEIPRDAVWMNAVTYLADAVAILGDRDLATTLHAELAPHADRIAIVDRGLLCKGSVAHWVGLLEATIGDADAARRSLGRAVAVHRELGATLLEAASADALAALG